MGEKMSFLFPIAQGRQEQAAYNYNADINERNAKVAEQEAEQLVFQEEQSIVQFREDISDLQDATAMAYRYNGWIAEEGTPLKVALANAQEADEEIATRRYNAAVGRAELTEGATQERLQGNLNRMYGKAARRAGQFAAASSLLSSAAKVRTA